MMLPLGLPLSRGRVEAGRRRAATPSDSRHCPASVARGHRPGPCSQLHATMTLVPWTSWQVRDHNGERHLMASVAGMSGGAPDGPPTGAWLFEPLPKREVHNRSTSLWVVPGNFSSLRTDPMLMPGCQLRGRVDSHWACADPICSNLGQHSGSVLDQHVGWDRPDMGRVRPELGWFRTTFGKTCGGLDQSRGGPAPNLSKLVSTRCGVHRM